VFPETNETTARETVPPDAEAKPMTESSENT
jgi:hypothetical protein